MLCRQVAAEECLFRRLLEVFGSWMVRRSITIHSLLHACLDTFGLGCCTGLRCWCCGVVCRRHGCLMGFVGVDLLMNSCIALCLLSSCCTFRNSQHVSCIGLWNRILSDALSSVHTWYNWSTCEQERLVSSIPCFSSPSCSRGCLGRPEPASFCACTVRHGVTGLHGQINYGSIF